MARNIWLLNLLLLLVPRTRGELPVTANAAIEQATAKLWEAAPNAEADPTRPLYHFHSPARWMNDPNGPLYYQGFYHLFYQCNPFGESWGHMHWGHARSRDLVHWQQLPIALSPSAELNEEHVFSGCAVINGKGQPMIFYTSVHQDKPAELFAEQWAALGDKNMITWQKYPANPVLKEEINRGVKIFDWRDPYIFQETGHTYMVIGGNLNQRHGGKAVVSLYQAENDQLTRWKYSGILFTHPDALVTNVECPNFFRLNNRWVLLVSPHGPVEYFVGDFEPSTPQFRPSMRAQLDHGADFYAPNGLVDWRGRHLIWGWIKGFKDSVGWNGCLSLPRVLTLGNEGELLQRPAPELRKLRADHFRLTDISLDKSMYDLAGVRGDSLEIYAEAELRGADSFQLHVRRSADGSRSIAITFDGSELTVNQTKIPFRLHPQEKTLKLNVFLDRSVLELFVNSRECYTGVIYPGKADLGVALATSGGLARVHSFHAWKMRSIW